MNAFTDLFIRRPVLASVVSLLILLVGGMAAFRLQVRQFPETSNTTITITTTYPGAAADVIKGFITTPIEQAVASAEGIDTLVSTSQQNTSTITLNLRLDANPDRAMADTLSKVNQVRGRLPRDANDPVVVEQTGQGFALMYLSFNSKVMTPSQITDYLTRVVQPTLADRGRRRQRPDSRRPDLRHAHLARPDPHGVARRDRERCAAALPPTISRRRPAGQGRLHPDQRPPLTSLDERQGFGQLVITHPWRRAGAPRDVAKIELGPRASTPRQSSTASRRCIVGIYRHAGGQSADRDQRRARRSSRASRASCRRAQSHDRL